MTSLEQIYFSPVALTKKQRECCERFIGKGKYDMLDTFDLDSLEMIGSMQEQNYGDYLEEIRSFRDQDYVALKESINRLAPRTKQVLNMYLSGYRLFEIAKELNLSRGNISGHVREGIIQLKLEINKVLNITKCANRYCDNMPAPYSKYCCPACGNRERKYKFREKQ